MDLLSLEDFTIDTLQYLINNEVEENIHLDYKDGRALQTNDRGKNDITKDVSSFANSDGGILVYGLSEKDHKPTSVSPFDGNAFTKERLDQIISNIQPHIKGVKIYPIRIQGDVRQSVYVVKIPRSPYAPHMASDHRYYKRSNFQSVAMEDYEVRDLFCRVDKPELDIEICFCTCINEEEVYDENDWYKYRFTIKVMNIGRIPCDNFKIALICEPGKFDYHYKFSADTINTHSLSQTILREGKIKVTFGSRETIFPEEGIDFSLILEIPYSYVNQFLDASEFKIVLWFDGGPKVYKYNLKEETFDPLEE